MTRLYRDALPARTLMHLAENGPTEVDALRAAMSTDENSRTGLVMALSRLKELGFVQTKVWMTPKGLEELRRLEALPQRAGLAQAEPEGAAA